MITDVFTKRRGNLGSGAWIAELQGSGAFELHRGYSAIRFKDHIELSGMILFSEVHLPGMECSEDIILVVKGLNAITLTNDQYYAIIGFMEGDDG